MENMDSPRCVELTSDAAFYLEKIKIHAPEVLNTFISQTFSANCYAAAIQKDQLPNHLPVDDLQHDKLFLIYSLLRCL